MLYLDSDNALGSKSGDVDDAFAIAAVLSARVPVAALGSVFGNTGGEQADANNRNLARALGFQGSCLRGATRPGDHDSPAITFLLSRPPVERVLALGPLTNFAGALGRDPEALSQLRELVIVGGNYSSLGILPPIWPFEFNLTHDRQATRTVFDSRVPLTFVPLDVAVRLRIRFSEVRRLRGPASALLIARSARWFTRARWLKARATVPIWDLVAAMLVLEPGLFSIVETRARLSRMGKVCFNQGTRPVRVVLDYSPERVWSTFADLLQG